MFDRNQRAWVARLAERRDAGRNHAVAAGVDHGPKTGDMVITREVDHHRVRYTIGRLGQQPQLTCDSRDRALTVARAYARTDAVGIWEHDGRRFTSVAPRGHGVQ
jgi:hypothetical protein